VVSAAKLVDNNRGLYTTGITLVLAEAGLLTSGGSLYVKAKAVLAVFISVLLTWALPTVWAAVVAFHAPGH
jgi:hypothetical protein